MSEEKYRLVKAVCLCVVTISVVFIAFHFLKVENAMDQIVEHLSNINFNLQQN